MSRTIIPLLLLFSACSFQASSSEEPAMESAAQHFELLPERTPADGESLWLEVRIGALPAATSLIIRDAEGERIGVISPYGELVRQAGGSHLVPLPESMQSEKVSLRVALALAGDKVRRPTETELEELRLVYVPTNL